MPPALMLGHLGGAALAAAGPGAGLYYTLLMVCQGVLTAVAPLAAHAIGAGDNSAAGRIAGAGMTLAMLLAFPVLGLLMVARRALMLLGYDPALAVDIAHFLSAIRWGSPAFLAFVVLRSMLTRLIPLSCRVLRPYGAARRSARDGRAATRDYPSGHTWR